jgi:regulator of protease activity HflC (stomatin/prohibitin superfamily)
MSEKNKFFSHWPTLLLGFIVASFFLVAIFSFQIEETETAIVTTLGTPSEKTLEPGIHLRWPYPIQEVYRFDRRFRCFSGTIAKDGQETSTRDNQNIIVSIPMIDPLKYPIPVKILPAVPIIK